MNAPDAPVAQDRTSSWVGRVKWVLAVSAILLAIISGRIIEAARTGAPRPDAPPFLAWLVLGVAAVLLVVAAWPPPKLQPADAAGFLDRFRSMQRKRSFIALLVGAVVCAVAAVPLFWTLNAAAPPESVAGNWWVNTGSWVLYLTTLLLFGAAFVVWERTTRWPQVSGWLPGSSQEHGLSRQTEWTLMFVLFGLALLLRLRNLETVPPGLWFDEAYHGYVAMQLVAPGGIHKIFVPDIVHFGALYFYLLGGVLSVTGNSVWALRLLPALSGALIAPVLYLLGARLYGWRVGLAAGGLVAVSAWHLTFSRLGMVSMFTVVLDVAVFLCMVQALRTARLGYFAGGGILLGLALQAYYIARLVPLVLAVLLAHLVMTERARVLRPLRAGVVVFAAGTLLAFLPVGMFAVQRPEDFQSRLSTVSIFSPQNSGGDLSAALGRNVRTHLLMFNWQGDTNGRHNLPSSPMLDWLAAALFFAGLGSCLLRAWRWQYAFPVVWFAFTIAAGVLTMPSEAPQSHRTLENSVVTALLAGIFLGEAWGVVTGARTTQWLGTRLAPAAAAQLAAALGAAGVVVVTAWAGAMDIHKYFMVQATSGTVWNSMDGENAYAGRTAVRYGANKDYDVYVAPRIKSTHGFQYLTPHLDTLDWPGMYALPLPASKPGGAIIILDPASAADVAVLARMYPHATFEVAGASDEAPLLYVVKVPAADIATVHGVRAAVSDAGSEQPKSDEIIPDLHYDWSGAGARASTLRLSTTLQVQQYTNYTFDLADEAGELWVDGYRLAAGQPIPLASGLHSVVVTETVHGARGASNLYWSIAGSRSVAVPASNLFDPRKVEPHGLTGLYRPGDDPHVTPEMARVDRVISFRFHTTPLPRPYSVDWAGRIYIPETGRYTFGTMQRSTSQLFLDGQEIITNEKADALKESAQHMAAGWHDIRVIFVDQDNYSHIGLYWTPPGRPRSIIPSPFLWPVLGHYPTDSDSARGPALGQADGTQLPPDRVTHVP